MDAGDVQIHPDIAPGLQEDKPNAASTTLFVQQLNGHMLSLEINVDATLGDLKRKIREEMSLVGDKMGSASFSLTLDTEMLSCPDTEELSACLKGANTITLIKQTLAVCKSCYNTKICALCAGKGKEDHYREADGCTACGGSGSWHFSFAPAGEVHSGTGICSQCPAGAPPVQFKWTEAGVKHCSFSRRFSLPVPQEQDVNTVISEQHLGALIYCGRGNTPRFLEAYEQRWIVAEEQFDEELRPVLLAVTHSD